MFVEDFLSPGVGVVDGGVYGLLREDPSAALDLDHSHETVQEVKVKIMIHLKANTFLSA